MAPPGGSLLILHLESERAPIAMALPPFRTPSARLLLAILLVAFFFRLAGLLIIYGANPRAVLQPDSSTYENPALALLACGRFAQSPAHPDVPETIRTPGYPLLIAAVYAVFGQNRPALIVVQVLLSLATIGVLYAMVRRFWGERPALLAAALLALDPVSWLYANMILTETGFTLLLVLTLAAVARLLASDAHEKPRAFLGGLFLALAVHFRPIAYYLVVPAVAGVVVVKLLRRRPLRAVLAQALLFLLPWVVLVGGWQWRNKVAVGRGQFSAGGVERQHVFFVRAIDLQARRQGIPYEQAEAQVLQSFPAGLTPTQKAALQDQTAKALFRQNLPLFIRDSLFSMAKMFGPCAPGILLATGHEIKGRGPLGDLFRLPPSQFIRQWPLARPGASLLFLAEILYTILLVGGAAIGFTLAWFRERPLRPVHLWFVGVMAYMITLTAISGFGYDRYRAPLNPLLALYAALGLSCLLASRRAPSPTSFGQ